MPAEAAQLEMADLNDWFGNFNGESIGHEQGPADVLAEEFQPAEATSEPRARRWSAHSMFWTLKIMRGPRAAVHLLTFRFTADSLPRLLSISY